MRARLILLLILCGIMLTLQALPADAIQAAATGKSLIWIDLSAMSLTLYQNQQQVGRWPIAAGASDTPTPLGVYYIRGDSCRRIQGSVRGFSDFPFRGGNTEFMAQTDRGRLAAARRMAASACIPGTSKRFIAWCQTEQRL